MQIQTASGESAPEYRLPRPFWTALTSGDLAAGLALLVAVLAFFWPMLRPGNGRLYLQEGDFSRQFFPFRWFAAHEWWAHRIPLWNPDVFAGHPFQADVQTAVFYPIAAADAVLFGRGGLPYLALEGEVVGHTFLAGLFTYALVRFLTGSRLGGLASGFAFAFGGFITTYPAEQLPILETAVWLPLIVLFLARGAVSPIRWRWLVAAGLALGVAILAGHPQTILFIIYATEGFLVWRLWQQGTRWTSLGVAAVTYPLLAAGVAAIQILPSVALLRESTRDQMSYTEASWGYQPSALVQIVVPLWHDEKAMSVGVVALLLALIGAWASRREPLAYWTVVGLVAIPLSVGGATPLFWLLYHVAPGWNLFRDQERAIYLFSFGAAVLAGRGIAALQRPDLPGRLLDRWILITVAGTAGFAGMAAIGLLRPVPAPLEWNLALDSAALAGVALLLFGRRLAPGRAAVSGLGLVALVGGELFLLNAGNNLSPASPDPRPRLEATAAYLRPFGEPFRVRGVSEKVFPSNYGALLGLPTIGGDTPFQIRRMRDMLAADADWRVWQILNVKFFISDGGPLAGLTPVFRDGNLTTYRMDDSLPRAWAVRAVEVARSPDDARQLILAPGYHPGNLVVLEQPPSIGPFTPGPRPDVRITHLDPQRIEIDADAAGPAMLVLAQQDYPDWVAYRDGAPISTFRANYLAMAFELPAGHHHFTIVYRPWSFYLGAALSVLATLVAARWIIWPGRAGAGSGRG